MIASARQKGGGKESLHNPSFKTALAVISLHSTLKKEKKKKRSGAFYTCMSTDFFFLKKVGVVNLFGSSDDHAAGSQCVVIVEPIWKGKGKKEESVQKTPICGSFIIHTHASAHTAVIKALWRTLLQWTYPVCNFFHSKFCNLW